MKVIENLPHLKHFKTVLGIVDDGRHGSDSIKICTSAALLCLVLGSWPLRGAASADLKSLGKSEEASGTSVKPLSPFTINLVPNWARDSDLYEQKTAPVCVDLLAYLNHPRSNELFKPDGSLVRDSDKFQSVHWEALDKEQYREGFMTLVTSEHQNIQAVRLKLYADPKWMLQRIQAHPYESWPKENRPERWVYRLVSLRPYTRNRPDSASKVELPTWFPDDSMEWLGDAFARVGANEVKILYGARRQWIVHGGTSYAIENATYGDGKGALPKRLNIDVHKLIVNGEGQSFLRQACALHARNKE